MNWFTKLFNRNDKKPNDVSAPSLENYMQDPQLSCFARGLIRSMKETPEKWERSLRISYYRASWAFQGMYFLIRDDSSVILGGDMDTGIKYEQDMIKIEAHNLETNFLKKLSIEEEEQRAQRRARFEKLGCPSS